MNSEQRKKDHLELTSLAQMPGMTRDSRFYYEPLLNSHPHPHLYKNDGTTTYPFLGYKLNAPFWISSMTGGTENANLLNQNLAKAAFEFKIGMGLGSIRPLLENRSAHIKDFKLRSIVGFDSPFMANLGVAQLARLIEENRLDLLYSILDELEVNGLFIHVNPLQEWRQKGGDHFHFTPFFVIENFLNKLTAKNLLKHPYHVMVKEVGQGMGPSSLHALSTLPLSGLELAAFGGTNFTKLEMLRSHDEAHFEWAKIGEDALSMVEYINEIEAMHKWSIIISGGVHSVLDGYYLKEKAKFQSVIGMAKKFLDHGQNYDTLQRFLMDSIESWAFAQNYLRIKI